MTKKFFLAWLKMLGYTLRFLGIVGGLAVGVIATGYFFGPIGITIVLLLLITFIMTVAEGQDD